MTVYWKISEILNICNGSKLFIGKKSKTIVSGVYICAVTNIY